VTRAPSLFPFLALCWLAPFGGGCSIAVHSGPARHADYCSQDPCYSCRDPWEAPTPAQCASGHCRTPAHPQAVYRVPPPPPPAVAHRPGPPPPPPPVVRQPRPAARTPAAPQVVVAPAPAPPRREPSAPTAGPSGITSTGKTRPPEGAPSREAHGSSPSRPASERRYHCNPTEESRCDSLPGTRTGSRLARR
jgi:hypothetical protein